MNQLRVPLRRSSSNRMVAGVLGGLAEYFKVDPTVVRVVFVLVAIFTAGIPAIIAYFVLWAVMPEL
jgi:phage shock protein PspC (stress-responsive transcriptional regulator)